MKITDKQLRQFIKEVLIREVAAPKDFGGMSVNDPYVYRRQTDGWYTRKKDSPATKPWVFLNPNNNNFAKAIVRLNKMHPDYTFDISATQPQPKEKQQGMAASPPGTPKGGNLVIKSEKITGNFLSTKTVNALKSIAEGGQPTLDEESSMTAAGTYALLAAQFILDFPQDVVWTTAFEDKVKEFQKSRPNLSQISNLSSRATNFGDDDTYGKIDAATANELLSRSPSAKSILAGKTIAAAPKPYTISSETLPGAEGLVIMPEIKEKALKDAQRMKGGTQVGKLNLDLPKLRAGQTCKVGLCSTYWCSDYVAEVFMTPTQRADAGDAWLQHSLEASKSGRLKFSGFMNLDSNEINLVTKAYRLANKAGTSAQISQIVGNLVPSQEEIKSQLSLGDIVGLYNKSSTFFSTAVHAAGAGRFYNPKTNEQSDDKMQPMVMWEPNPLLNAGTGFGMNTHLGFVGAMLDNTPIIFHNIHNEVFATPVTTSSDYPVLWAKKPLATPTAS